MPKREYKLHVEFYGLQAYVIDELLKTGLYGTTKEGVVERIIGNWVREQMSNLEVLGITVQGAVKKKYIPINIKEESD